MLFGLSDPYTGERRSGGIPCLFAPETRIPLLAVVYFSPLNGLVNEGVFTCE